MFCTLVIIRYPKYLGLFGFLSMLFFRFPLALNKKIKFWKLMGTGKSGSFDMRPDLGQWAIFFVSDDETTNVPSSIYRYCKFFRCKLKQILMQPVAAHGLWDRKEVFQTEQEQNILHGPIAVLTRATIRLTRLRNFWKNATVVTKILNQANGLIFSAGMGEAPLIKQATFSVWESESLMETFAYRTHEHRQVIQKTRSEKWYSEELFVRLRIISVSGFDEVIASKMCNLPASNEEA